MPRYQTAGSFSEGLQTCHSERQHTRRRGNVRTARSLMPFCHRRGPGDSQGGRRKPGVPVTQLSVSGSGRHGGIVPGYSPAGAGRSGNGRRGRARWRIWSNDEHTARGWFLQ
ncbi:hypothetical protein DPEC_G00278690 [Dallia pectoralis]|uniref:Uncharacterized protein n=1 Tax=Dallia pectoralis TaxID=75939 RepID=A0ACC2FM43_DALPE|nr:hypothetical protein DPEC_G00278690 [Dallia pectoralis]